MKKYLIPILFALLSAVMPLSLSAQQQTAANMSVKSFKYLPTDNTANLEGTIVKDQNGDKCALIRVQTTETGFAFDSGQMKPCKIEYKVGEVWVYVPYGVKRMTIRHPKLGTLADYSFPVPIEKARTYNMELVTAQIVTTVVAPLVTSQYVVFTVTPENALVELDGEILTARDGSISKLVKLGEHKYRVSCNDYHEQSGTVNVNDTKNRVKLSIELKPAYGNLTVGDKLSDAVIVIDGKKTDFPAGQSVRLPSGKHVITVSKPMYESQTLDVTISDGKTYELAPTLKPNFRKITIKSVEGAEIWLNGVKMGTASWTGNIENGLCRIEIKKEGYRTVEMETEITSAMPESVITPAAPEPIFSAIQIESTPSDAIVSLDGQEIGLTPLVRSDILVGRHTISLSANGCETVTQEIVVEEGKICQYSSTMGPSLGATPSSGGNVAVDMGLSVKWASCNLGAAKPEEYGRHYAWGDVVGKTWNGVKWSGEAGPYNTLKSNLKLGNDAAHVVLKGKWRMPTIEEFNELVDNYTIVLTIRNGVKGRLFTSKKNGNSIFLPAAGGEIHNKLLNRGVCGFYWSSTFSENEAFQYAWAFCFNYDKTGTNYFFRYRGFSIRPVLAK